MFTANKYTATYNRLIEQARGRERPSCYTERHHIIPRSLGGTNHRSNLVYLTAREHFIAHLLLTKMVDGDAKFKMYCAAIRVTAHEKKNGQLYRKGNSWSYEAMRKSHSKMLSDRMKGNTFKKGVKESEETKARKRAAMQASDVMGKWERTPEFKARISAERKGMNAGEKNGMNSAEARAKVSEARSGQRRYTDGTGTFKYFKPDRVPEGYALCIKKTQ